jgi:hypothetical protein
VQANSWQVPVFNSHPGGLCGFVKKIIGFFQSFPGRLHNIFPLSQWFD